MATQESEHQRRQPSSDYKAKLVLDDLAAQIHPDGYLLTHLSANLANGPVDRDVIRALLNGKLRNDRIEHDIDNESLYFAQWGRHDLFVLTRSIGLPRNALQTFSDNLVSQLRRVRSHHHAFAFRFEDIGADPFDENTTKGKPLLCLATLSLNATLTDFYGLSFIRWTMQTIQRSIAKHNNDVVTTLLVDLGVADIYVLLFTRNLKESYDLIYWKLRTLTAGQARDSEFPFGFVPAHASERLVTLTYSSACFRPGYLEKAPDPNEVGDQLFPATVNIAVEPGDEKSVDLRFRAAVSRALGSDIHYEWCHIPGEFDLRYTFVGTKDRDDTGQLKLRDLLKLRKEFIPEKTPVPGIRRIMTEYTIPGNEADQDSDGGNTGVVLDRSEGSGDSDTIASIPYHSRFSILAPAQPGSDPLPLQRLPNLPGEIPTYFYHSLRSLFVTYEEYLRDPLYCPRVVSYHPFISQLYRLFQRGLPDRLNRPAQTQFFTQVLIHVTEAYRNLRQGDFREAASYPLSIRAGFQKLVDACYGVVFEAWQYARVCCPDLEHSEGLYPLILFTTDPRMQSEDYNEEGLTVTRVGLPVLFQFSDAAKIIHEVAHVVFRARYLRRFRAEIAAALRKSLARIIARNLNRRVAGLDVEAMRELALEVITEAMPNDELVVQSLGRIESYTPHVDRLIDLLTDVGPSTRHKPGDDGGRLERLLRMIDKPREQHDRASQYTVSMLEDESWLEDGALLDEIPKETSDPREKLIGDCRHAVVRSLYRDVDRLRLELAEVFADVFMVVGVGWTFEQYLAVYELDADLHLLGQKPEPEPRILRDLYGFRLGAVRHVLGLVASPNAIYDYESRARSDIKSTEPVLELFKSFFDDVTRTLECEAAPRPAAAGGPAETGASETESKREGETVTDPHTSAPSADDGPGFGLLTLFRPLAALAKERLEHRRRRPQGQRSSSHPKPEDRTNAYLRELSVLLRFQNEYRQFVAQTNPNDGQSGMAQDSITSGAAARDFNKSDARSFLDLPKSRADASERELEQNRRRFAADARRFLKKEGMESGCVILNGDYFEAKVDHSDSDIDGLWETAQATGVAIGESYDATFREAQDQHKLPGPLFYLDTQRLKAGVLITSEDFDAIAFESLLRKQVKYHELSLEDFRHGNSFHCETIVCRDTMWAEYLKVSIRDGEFLGHLLMEPGLTHEHRIWANQYLFIKTLYEILAIRDRRNERL